MQFRVVRQTAGGMLVLKSDSNQPVEKPTPLWLGKKRIGRLVETIGLVGAPHYLAVLDPAMDSKLVGKTLMAFEGQKQEKR